MNDEQLWAGHPHPIGIIVIQSEAKNPPVITTGFFEKGILRSLDRSL